MTVQEFPLPDLGEGLTEGEILAWLVEVGDVIELNQPIVEVETAKAAVEIPAKWAGKVVEIHHPAGTVVEVGAPIIAIDTDPDGATASAAVAADPAADSQVSPGGLIGEATANGRTAVLVGYGPRTTAAKRRPRRREPVVTFADRPTAPTIAATPATVTTQATVTTPATAAATTTAAAPAHENGPVLAKPPVRKLAKDLGVDLTVLVGTGPQGSITREDVRAVADRTTAGEAAAVRSATATGGQTRIPVKGVRKLTAANTVASAFTAPHVTEFLTVDVTRSVKALKRLKADPQWRDVRVSPLLLAAKAVLLAIRRHPMVNSSWDEAAQEIVVKDYVNLGIAAATDRGLIVPNIAGAERMTMRELADALTELVAVAKAGKTPPSAMSGGTFTITNVGVFGVDTGTPILPPGEAAILAFGAIREQPWAYKRKVKLRQVTTLGLSFDHRIVDGELGSKFLRDVGAFLSDPEAALLSWA